MNWNYDVRFRIDIHVNIKDVMLVRLSVSLLSSLPTAGTSFSKEAARWLSKPSKSGTQWHWMIQQGHKINPCNSRLHPAVTEAGIEPEGQQELCVQQAYTPQSMCFGCGPAHPDGLKVQSKRIENGLEAHLRVAEKFCAFPGIVNGGVVSTIMDCHGNWTAAIALMDRSCLPKPPLTLTASMFVTYKEPTPPNTDLVVRSQVVEVKENTHPGLGKATVEVDVSVYQLGQEGDEKLLATGTGIFKRLGALRAM